MAQNVLGETTDLPAIEPHKDQQLIISFIKNEVGNECITIAFEPEITEVKTPAQAAAYNVANHIIKSFGLGQDEQQNGDQNGEKKSSIILPN